MEQASPVSSASRRKDGYCLLIWLEAFCLWGGSIFNANHEMHYAQILGVIILLVGESSGIVLRNKIILCKSREAAGLAFREREGSAFCPQVTFSSPEWMLCGQPCLSSLVGRMGQPSRRREQTQAE